MKTRGSGFELEDRQNYLLVSCDDGVPLTLKLVSEMVEKEMQIDSGRGLNDIWDLRSAAVSDDLNYQGIKTVVDQVKAIRDDVWHRKTAIVVGEDFRYGFARMYKSLAIDLPMDVGIFSDIRQAERWLSSDKNR